MTTNTWCGGMVSELLRVQVKGACDGRGRLRGCDGFAIACSDDGDELWIGDGVEEHVAARLTAAFDATPRVGAIDVPPAALDECRGVVDGPLKNGPSFVFGDDSRFAVDARIVRSGDGAVDELRGANPGNWEAVEWDELLEGRLGPWAMVVDAGRVVSIAHTPVAMTVRAAECGVWTGAAWRGRGYAAAVASAWAELLRPSGRALFYSTDAENRASRAVAARLRLRCIGWRWFVGLRAGGGRHPLSRAS